MFPKSLPTPRRHRFRLRLTMIGWVFFSSLVLILSAALNTGINLLYMLSAGLLSFLLVSTLVTILMLRKVQVQVTIPNATHRGSEIAVSVVVENRKWVLPAAGLSIESSNAPGLPLGFLGFLGRREVGRVRVREIFNKRGEYPVPDYAIITNFPFGIVERWTIHPGTGTLLVYPRVNALRTSAAEQSAGSRYRARTVSGDGDEFFSMREYLPGDDIRRISWRASARMGKLVVRELARQNSRFVIFLLDTRLDKAEPESSERFEAAVELVASLGVTLVERQYNVGIECPQACLEGGEGTGQKRRLLEFLARIQPTTSVEYPEFDELHCRLDTHAAALLYVTPDAALWGNRLPGRKIRALDPREVIHA